jgi:hypothetical protein
MALWSNADEANSAPQYTVDIVTGNTGVQAYGLSPVGTFGIDADEAETNSKITHAGWTLRTEGSGGRAGRVFHETLVAMGSMTGDGDSIPPLPVITIDTQPTAQSESEGSNAVFTVVASADRTSTLSYQWQKAEAESNTTFVNIVGATSDTYETPALTVLDDDGDFYRVVVSGTNGAVSVISDAVELTVTP